MLQWVGEIENIISIATSDIGEPKTRQPKYNKLQEQSSLQDGVDRQPM